MRLALALALALAVAGCSTPLPDDGPCRSPPLNKGPWVMRADDTSAAVFWETRDPGCVALGLTLEAGGSESLLTGASVATTVESSYGVNQVMMPDIAGTYYLARVDATKLSPGTCYTYRVRATDGAPDARGRFCTARPPSLEGQPLRFFVIGDTNPRIGHTADVLKHTLPEKPDFLLHTGDIQYYSSTETWSYWFGAMAPMLRAGAFFPAIGNHEDEKEGGGTEFADYYDRLFHQPSLDGDGTPKWYRFTSGGVWFHTIDTEEPYDSGSPQYLWLSESLKEVAQKPGYRLSVIYMHRNLYTIGDAHPNVEVRKSLAPLFAAYKVRLVLSGHMHGYERFEVGSITYITTAGGGGIITEVTKNAPLYPEDAKLRVVGLPAYHAMLFDVRPLGTATELHGRAIDESGATLDDFTHTIP
ncbi:MAG: hypothetical protein EXR72_05435 [Myxococcales bacterium]|nr:hypothetical protein [Myxococcales bacterium]